MEEKLLKIIESNKNSVLLIESNEDIVLPNSISISSSIDSKDLGILSDVKGQKIPQWLMALMLAEKKNKKIILVINDIDQVDLEEQNKFVGLITFKGVNGYKFDSKTQIILTCNDLNKVNEKLKNLVIIAKG